MGNNWKAANLRAEQKGIPGRYWKRGEGYCTMPATRPKIKLWLDEHLGYPIADLLASGGKEMTEELREHLWAFITFLKGKGIKLDKWKWCSDPGTRDVSPAMISELIDEFLKGL